MNWEAGEDDVFPLSIHSKTYPRSRSKIDKVPENQKIQIQINLNVPHTISQLFHTFCNTRIFPNVRQTIKRSRIFQMSVTHLTIPGLPQRLSNNVTTQIFPNIHHTFGNTRIFPNVCRTISQPRIFQMSVTHLA